MARKSETDPSRYDLPRGERGKYLDKARRSFETIVVDKRVLEAVGGAEGLYAILDAMVKSIRSRAGRRSDARRERDRPTLTNRPRALRKRGA